MILIIYILNKILQIQIIFYSWLDDSQNSYNLDNILPKSYESVKSRYFKTLFSLIYGSKQPQQRRIFQKFV